LTISTTILHATVIVGLT